MSTSSDKSALADLIASHGESSATAWLEPRYDVWYANDHAAEKPKAQGYCRQDGWALAWGNPLCADADLGSVAKDFIAWTDSEKLKILWCCVDEALEHVLAGLGYSTLTCIKEDVLDPTTVNLSTDQIAENVKRAEGAGVQVEEVSAPVDDAVKKKVDSGLEEWESQKGSGSIQSASLQPWLDEQHRRYWIACSPENKIIGVLILTGLKDSYQIKNSVSFPSYTSSFPGVPELLLARALEKLREEDTHSVTFGVSASEKLEPVDNLGVHCVSLYLGSERSLWEEKSDGVAEVTGLEDHMARQGVRGDRENYWPGEGEGPPEKVRCRPRPSVRVLPQERAWVGRDQLAHEDVEAEQVEAFFWEGAWSVGFVDSRGSA